MTDRSPPVLNRSVPAGIFVKVDTLSIFVWRFSIVAVFLRVDILNIFVWRFGIVAGGFFCGDNEKIYSSMSQNKITVDMHLCIVYI